MVLQRLLVILLLDETDHGPVANRGELRLTMVLCGAKDFLILFVSRP
jgi:hypothetical protein